MPITYDDFQHQLPKYKEHRKYAHVNFQSITTKPDEYQEFVENMNDGNTIIGISETWLSKQDGNFWSHDLNTLSIFRYDRNSSTKKKGGLLLLVPKN
jgi:hypothetical protein